MRLKLDISPCPNDTFVFYGLMHGVVDCEGLDFEVNFHDISTLNDIAIHHTVHQPIENKGVIRARRNV